jgi:signal transduction histidine kinase
MTRRSRKSLVEGAISDFTDGRQTLPGFWGRQEFWQIKVRWAVAPLMIAGLIVGRAIGFEFPVLPILLIALANPVYNAVFAWILARYEDKLAADPDLDRIFALLEIITDYLTMFLLIYFTGGVTSPLVVFLIFHVVITAIQFPPRMAYQMAALAAAGLWLLLVGDVTGAVPSIDLVFRGQPVHTVPRGPFSGVALLFFTATLFLIANIVTRIMGQFRSRVRDLAEVTSELADLTDRLNSLYAMVGSISAERRLEPMLETVTTEMARVMEVSAVAVKLLGKQGKTLRYVAAHGLPDKLVQETVIELERSPLNRRIMEGETLVQGVLGGDEGLQLEKDFRALGIQSAILAPLKVEDRVSGTLGVYARREGRFDTADSDFLKLAAELVAIGIEDARVNEEVERLMEERTQFMLQVAHNLRAPLSAGLSMLELVKDGYAGEINEKQADYLRRVDNRLRTLNQTIGELLSIARTRDTSREIPDVVVDLSKLGRYTEETFKQHAACKNIRFEVSVDSSLPRVDSGLNVLEQVMDNLVSNAIKYTPEGGRVGVRFRSVDQDETQALDQVEIVVEDSGIGIPAKEQHKLFQDFFRASNAKQLTTNGTGLGLVLVKQAVERHQGKMRIESQEGHGTIVTLQLPASRPHP